MKTYQIVTDSSCDLPQEIVSACDLRVIPLLLHMNNKTYLNLPDGSDISFEDFFTEIRKGTPATTSAVNPETFNTVFTQYLEQGLDVLYLGFSSALSCTYQNACIAAQTLREKYPERKLIMIDTLCASIGQGLLCYLTAQKQKDGATLAEAADFVEANIPHLCHWFTVGDLKHLKRSGRISGATALIGTALHIKPVLHMDDEGRLVSVSKARGRKAALEALLEQMEKRGIDLASQTVFICHGDCLPEAEWVAGEIRNRFGVKEVIIHFVGPVIAAHAGADVLSVFFLGESR